MRYGFHDEPEFRGRCLGGCGRDCVTHQWVEWATKKITELMDKLDSKTVDERDPDYLAIGLD